jgi:CPA2 family monovalent cation:H+ antiporter-2
VLLLFGVGLHMDLSVLARGLKQMMAATLVSAAASILLLWPLCLLLSGSPISALVLAMALSISSTVVVLRVLQQRRELSYPEGRLSLSVLILQDLVAIGMLLALPPLARFAGTGQAEEAPMQGWNLAVSLIAGGALALATVAGIVAAGRFAMPRLLTEAARSKSSEVLIVLSTAAALGAAALTQRFIDNAAMGAFLAGFMLSSTPFRHQISGQVGAIRDLFGAVFFTAIGMSVAFGVLVDHFLVIMLGAVVLLAVKSVAMGVSFWLVGATGNVAMRSGVALSQAGEFSVLMLAAASAPAIGLLSQEEVGVAISIIVLTLMATPVLIQYSSLVNKRLPAILPPPWARAESKGPEGTLGTPLNAAGRPMRAIIAGYGLVGRAVSDELKKMGVTATIVELNPSTVRKQTELGRAVVFGDVSSVEVLENAGVHKADVLILTIPDEESVLRACRMAKEMKPDIYVVVRCSYVSQGILAASLGADGVVVEEMATAKDMERAVRIMIDRRKAEAIDRLADTNPVG